MLVYLVLVMFLAVLLRIILWFSGVR